MWKRNNDTIISTLELDQFWCSVLSLSLSLSHALSPFFFPHPAFEDRLVYTFDMSTVRFVFRAWHKYTQEVLRTTRWFKVRKMIKRIYEFMCEKSFLPWKSSCHWEIIRPAALQVLRSLVSRTLSSEDCRNRFCNIKRCAIIDPSHVSRWWWVYRHWFPNWIDLSVTCSGKMPDKSSIFHRALISYWSSIIQVQGGKEHRNHSEEAYKVKRDLIGV